MTDLTITRSGEFMVAQVQGDTEGGVRFVDSYIPSEADYTVVDAGRIVIDVAGLRELIDEAAGIGLEVVEYAVA